MSRATKVHVQAMREVSTIGSHSRAGRWDWRTEHLEWMFAGICGTAAERHMLTLEPIFWDVPAAVRCRRCEHLLDLDYYRYYPFLTQPHETRVLPPHLRPDRPQCAPGYELERATTVECALIAIARYVASSGFRFEPLVDHPRPSLFDGIDRTVASSVPSWGAATPDQILEDLRTVLRADAAKVGYVAPRVRDRDVRRFIGDDGE